MQMAKSEEFYEHKNIHVDQITKDVTLTFRN